MKKKNSILLDVAQLAGVSRATAARALGGYSTVKKETRERVMDAARQLNYQTNEVARAMRSGRTRTIGVVVSDISNSFFGAAVRSISDEALEAGYQTLLVNTNEDPEIELKAIRVLLEKRVDGLLVVPASPDKFVEFINENPPEVPIVLLDRKIDDLDIPSVITDDEASAFEAVSQLASLGHRNISVLVSTSAVETFSDDQPKVTVSTVVNRVTGARKACAAAGLSEDEAKFTFCHSDVEIAAQAAAEILRRKPSAVLATNEEMALGVLAACREINIEIGRDLSLISFDDAPWTSVHVPAISVIRRPVRELSGSAVRMLLDELAGKAKIENLVFPNALVSRESVRPH